ncbi:MAG: response regulator [Nitrososphaeraceae archaeon]
MILENKRKDGIKRIMIVDDEPDINSGLKVVLKREGFDVDTFDDPVDALERFKPKFYDLLILDIKMQRLDGLELYQKIKGLDGDVKICFLTASELYYERFRDGKYPTLDNDLFIRKPIANRELLRKINSILDQIP